MSGRPESNSVVSIRMLLLMPLLSSDCMMMLRSKHRAISENVLGVPKISRGSAERSAALHGQLKAVNCTARLCFALGK